VIVSHPLRGTLRDRRPQPISACRGCKTCFNKGEEHCPLNDDRDLLFDKIAASDGVVFASPTRFLGGRSARRYLDFVAPVLGRRSEGRARRSRG
jgi:hypothetical protein